MGIGVFCLGWLGGLGSSAIAQVPAPPVIPDQTLPTPSIVEAISEGSDRQWQIQGGTAAGQNLFHSFERFSVPTDHTVRFVPSGDIARIIARVTGADASLIDGILGSEGPASLFLINPNGLVLGPNAQLQLGGSFIGTTAESMVFADGTQFGIGTNGNATPLLTATVPLGLQFGRGSGEITGTGLGPTDTPGLTIAPGNTLGLIGRSLDFSGVAIAVPGGNLELGAVTDGTVGLSGNGLGPWQLDYGTVTGFGSLGLGQGSSAVGIGVDPRLSGAVTLTGGDITIARSQVASLASDTGPGVPITINSTGSLSILADPTDPPLSTGLFSAVSDGIAQPGGAIAVTADQLIIRDGGRIQSSSSGPGAAGNIQVAARTIALDGFTSIGPQEAPTFDNSPQSGIVSAALASGDSGTIAVEADQITLTNGGVIETASTAEASGRARSLDVSVAGSLLLEGVNPENPVQTSRLATLTFGDGIGEDLTVRAANITLRDGAQIVPGTSGRQRGGNLRLSVDGLLLVAGENLARPGEGAGSSVATIAFGSGQGGDVDVEASHIRLEDGGNMGTQALNNFLGVTTIPEAGSADSGQITVRADLIEIVGTSVFNSAVPSNIASATFGSGDSGLVVVEANNLRILNGGTLASSTLISFLGILEQPEAGTGNGGDLEVRVRDRIEVSGSGIGGEFPSTLGANSASFGDAGDTRIQTRELIIRDGGLVNSTAFALGNAGNLLVEADRILIEGVGATNGLPSQIAASALTPPLGLQEQFGIPEGSSGDTGQVTVIADRIDIRDGGLISVQHDGRGNAGTLTLEAGLLTLADGGQIRANTVAGTGGNAVVRSRSLQLRDDSQVSVEAGNIGNGGNLTLETDTLALLDTSTIRATAIAGQGGNISIVSQGLFLDPNSGISASSQLGIDGTVRVERPELDPGSQLIQLPETVVDPSDQIATGCAVDGENRFIVRGRGGAIAPFLVGDSSAVLWDDLRLGDAPTPEPAASDRPSTAAQVPSIPEKSDPSDPPNAPIVEAQGWRSRADGTIQLTHPGISPPMMANCQEIAATAPPSSPNPSTITP